MLMRTAEAETMEGKLTWRPICDKSYNLAERRKVLLRLLAHKGRIQSELRGGVRPQLRVTEPVLVRQLRSFSDPSYLERSVSC